MAGEKTEKATGKRRKDERKKGNVFTSKDITTIFSIIIVFFSLKVLMPMNIEILKNLISKYFLLGSTELIDKNDMTKYFIDGALAYIQVAMPILLISMLVNIVITMAQTKMLFSSKAFQFKGERLNPLSGLKKMVSLRSMVEVLKSLTKILLLVYIIYSCVGDKIMLFPRMMNTNLLSAVSYMAEIILDIVTNVGIYFAAIAVADYFYQWWQHEKNMKMSKQDIKDEYKQMEGDPQVKAQIKALQQQRARMRMMQSVPQADVIIRNPTHFAVAIKYDSEVDNAPIVIAKGADSLAFKIIEVGEEHGVYIMENKPLARALFDLVDLDQAIPAEYYQTIAEILAFIYSLRKKELG